MNTTELVIRSEEDAWRILKEACGDSFQLGPDFEIKFENWPLLEIHIDGRLFDSSLTTKVMRGFIELQKSINSSFASFCHNSNTSSVLTDAERDALEIVVKVGPGSTNLQAIINNALKEFVRVAGNKMTGNQVVIVVLGCALAWTGHSSWKTYLQNQKDREIARQELETRQFAGQQETERMKIFADAMKKEPKLQTVKDDAEEMYNEVFKGTGNARKVKIAAHELNHDELKALVRPARERSSEVRLDGDYRILKIDNSRMGHYLVEVRGADDTSFTAKLDESVIITNEPNKALLQNAFWTREPLRLAINGKKLRGSISQAIIIDVLDRYK